MTNNEIKNQELKEITTGEQMARYAKIEALEKQLKVEKEEIKNALMTAMDKVGLRKMESADFVATIVETQRVSCDDPAALEAWSKANNVPYDTQEIPADWVIAAAKEKVKSGVVPDGIKLSTSIFMKITNRKK